jgi:hypothetical protein
VDHSSLKAPTSMHFPLTLGKFVPPLEKLVGLDNFEVKEKKPLNPSSSKEFRGSENLSLPSKASSDVAPSKKEG